MGVTRDLELINKSEVKDRLQALSQRLENARALRVEDCEMARALYEIGAAIWELAENVDDGRPSPRLSQVRVTAAASALQNFNDQMRRRQ